MPLTKICFRKVPSRNCWESLNKGNWDSGVFCPACIVLVRLYCSGEIVLFWWNCIVVADNWSNNPGHSGLAVSGWRSLYYWIPALFNALLTSAYCCSPSHTIHAQRSKQPMSISWTSFPSNVWSKSSAAELQPYLELNRIYWFSISSTVLTFPEGQ